MMNISEIIMNQKMVRKYKKKKIPLFIIKKIINAGIWSWSIHGIQPWSPLIITRKSLIKKIAKVLQAKSLKIEARTSSLLKCTAKTIFDSPLLILIFNLGTFTKISKNFFKIDQTYLKIAELTEIEAISAAMQNMILVAGEYGIGCCWNTMPLFCEQEIGGLLKSNDQLIAMLTFGYPAQNGKRTTRRTNFESVRFIK